MVKPLPRAIRARRRWREGLLELLFTALGIGLGVLLPKVHVGATLPSFRTVEVLGAIGFGILGLVTVIYGLLFLVVQSSNTTYTPRLNIFQGDPLIWRTYASALGLFAYSITAFIVVGDAQRVSVVVPLFAFAAVLVVIALMRTVQARAFTSLQLNTTVDLLTRNGRRVIDALYPAGPTGNGPGAEVPTGGRPVRWPRPQAMLQQLDLEQLLPTADAADAVVVFRVGVGETLWEGGLVAEVYGTLDDEIVLGSCVTGVDRTFDQDPLLAFRLLSDIGLRSLSPAINDPASAVQVLDAVVGLLFVLARRSLAVGAVSSPAGVTRAYLDVPSWDEFLSEGLDELLVSSKNSPMVLARAIAALTSLSDQAPPDRRAAVDARLCRARADFGHPDLTIATGP
jgi:uncharacterized membrane protein